MTASVNHMPVTNTRDRMEKASLSEISSNSSSSSSSSSQPDFAPLGTAGAESNGSYVSEDHQDTLNGFQQLPSQVKRKHLLAESVTITDTPWRTSKEYTCDTSGLHEEICDFYEYLRPHPSEIKMRGDVILRTMSIILSRVPQAKVKVFGSFCTSLFLPTGDIDLVVYGYLPTVPLFTLEEDLRSYDVALEDSILIVDKARVPIIKFIDKLTEVRVDISFNHGSGLRGTHQVQQFVQDYPFLPKLVFVLKQFLYQRNLHDVYCGGISSYSLVLLLVSFLQLHPHYSATDSNPNLGVLLIEFFKLYGKEFDYKKTGITVLERGHYFTREEGAENSLLYVVDPSDPTQNAASGCFGLWQVKKSFEDAFDHLQSTVQSGENPAPKCESLLSDIVKVPKEVVEYRNWVDNFWLVPVPPAPPLFYLPVVQPHFSTAASPYFSIPPQPQAYIQHNTELSPGKHLNHSLSNNSSPPSSSASSSSHEHPPSKVAITS